MDRNLDPGEPEERNIYKAMEAGKQVKKLPMSLGEALDRLAGDEVIIPSFTFVSTANAVARLGATPVFVDIREDTLNLDESLVEAAITPRTKAILINSPANPTGTLISGERMAQVASAAERSGAPAGSACLCDGAIRHRRLV